MNAEVHEIPIEQIIVPPWVLRESESKVDDEILLKGIREDGIQQPLVLIQDGERYILVNGSRRLAIARELGLPRVPAVLAKVPPGVPIEKHARRLRFILAHHHQPLLPSQRATLVAELKKSMNLTNAEVARFRGVDEDTITNWMAVLRYIPEVVAAIDSGAITLKDARVFVGMTPDGQRVLWKRHAKEIAGAGEKAHKSLRAKYPPLQFPAFYDKPEQIAARLGQTQGKRKSAPRVDYSAAEKKRLMRDEEIRRSLMPCLSWPHSSGIQN
jgi:ParB/RepB/Spo0J family partition protein